MKVRIRTDGPRVLVAVDARAFLEIGPQEALDLATALRQAGLKAGEHLEAERLIIEGAICARAGLPFTLSDHPKIRDEVRKEAAWNSDLRRYMPGGVKAREIVGTPSVIQERAT